MSRLLRIPLSALLFLSFTLNANAHGGSGHEQIVVADDADWATRHMAGKGNSSPLHSTALNSHVG
jgi:hypothetical protein